MIGPERRAERDRYSRREDVRDPPGQDHPGLGDSESMSCLASKTPCSYNDLSGFHILVLFENPDGRVLAMDGILGDEDFFNLLLRRSVIHHI